MVVLWFLLNQYLVIFCYDSGTILQIYTTQLRCLNVFLVWPLFFCSCVLTYEALSNLFVLFFFCNHHDSFSPRLQQTFHILFNTMDTLESLSFLFCFILVGFNLSSGSNLPRALCPPVPASVGGGSYLRRICLHHHPEDSTCLFSILDPLYSCIYNFLFLG